MSVDAGLELFFGDNTTVGAILRHLLDAGWRGVDESSIVAVSLADDVTGVSPGMCSLERDASALDLRLSRGESFAVTMVWSASGRGGEFIFSLRDRGTFSPTIDRLTLGRRVTDVSWYLARIVPSSTAPVNSAVIAAWVWRESG